MSLLFLFVLTIEEWITEHLVILRIAAGGIILLLASTGKLHNKSTPINIQAITDENPWVKIYLIGYGIFIAFNIFSGANPNDGSFIGTLITLLLFLFLPFIIITQRDKFNSLK